MAASPSVSSLSENPFRNTLRGANSVKNLHSGTSRNSMSKNKTQVVEAPKKVQLLLHTSSRQARASEEGTESSELYSASEAEVVASKTPKFGKSVNLKASGSSQTAAVAAAEDQSSFAHSSQNTFENAITA